MTRKIQNYYRKVRELILSDFGKVRMEKRSREIVESCGYEFWKGGEDVGIRKRVHACLLAGARNRRRWKLEGKVGSGSDKS
jgi:hypothetical protein